MARRRSTRPLAVVEIPLLYETGGEARFDKVVVITAPRELREQRRGSFADREARLIPDEEKLKPRGLRVSSTTVRSTTSTRSSPAWWRSSHRPEASHRRRRGGGRCGRSIRVSAAHGAAVVGAHLVPAPVLGDRARARAQLRPEPGAARGGDRAGEQVQRATRKSSTGAVGLMQLLPDDGEGIAIHTGGSKFVSAICTTRRSTSATAPGTSAICSTSTATSGSRSPRTTPASRTSTRWRAEGRGRPVPGDARLRRPRRAAEGHLPAHVRARARARQLAAWAGAGGRLARRRTGRRRGGERTGADAAPRIQHGEPLVEERLVAALVGREIASVYTPFESEVVSKLPASRKR